MKVQRDLLGRTNKFADAYRTSLSTVRSLRKRLVEKGFEAALEGEKQAKRKSKWDGEMEAKLIAIACSKPPEGYSRWSVRLLAHHFSRTGNHRIDLSYCRPPDHEKNELKPWLKKQWCIPEASGKFVACMEDILDVYQRPADPKRPLICLDETNRQLTEETRAYLPVEPGKPKRVDYEYKLV